MAQFTVHDIREAMDNASQTRNVAILGPADSGKTILVDSLVHRAGIIEEEEIGSTRYTDYRPDEQERGLSIKATAISLLYEITNSDLLREATGNKVLVNLVDSPGHLDFSAEATAATRLTDGAVIVIDSVEGMFGAEGVIKQALKEQVKPVLMINKIDRLILELQFDLEQTYQTFVNIIDSFNAVINASDDRFPTVDPTIGTVAFGSGLQGWGFTLTKFAEMYATKYGVDKEKMRKRLWGDNYFDPETQAWTTTPTSASGKTLPRAFCKFVLEPIYKLTYCILNGESASYEKIISALKITLSEEEKKFVSRRLLKSVMKKFIPAADALLEIIIAHLPSPDKAQKYRVEYLYGFLADECTHGIRDCDRDAPLVLYVAKMFPSTNGGFYAVGRVLSGIAKTAQRIRVVGPDEGNSRGTYQDSVLKTCQRTVIMMGRHVEAIEDVPCGNIVGLVGVDGFLLNCGTISTSENAHPIRPMEFPPPLIRFSVAAKEPQHTVTLMKRFNILSQSDLNVRILSFGDPFTEIHVVSELHLEICLQDLAQNEDSIRIVSEPSIALRETVTEESVVCLAKSPNKHNWLSVQAKPLLVDLVRALESGEINNTKDNWHVLADRYGLDAQRIWSFGSETSPNMFVDASRSSALSEVKDTIVVGFKAGTEEGVLCFEKMYGVQFILTDGVFIFGAMHRRASQIIPTIRRAIYGSVLKAKPRLMEPVFLVNISCPRAVMNGVFEVLTARFAPVLSAIETQEIPQCHITAHLPGLKYLGFIEDLRSKTSGQAFAQCRFDHWKIIDSDPLQEGSTANLLARSIRQKDISPSIPPADNFID